MPTTGIIDIEYVLQDELLSKLKTSLTLRLQML